MIIEKSGDPVFTNVDDALAERIISRSRENCAWPAKADAAGPRTDDPAGGRGKPNIRQIGRLSLLKIAAVIAGALVLTLLIFGHGNKRDD